MPNPIPPIIIACGNAKGGVGKSTLAVNLASELSTKHRVRLLDADPQATVAQWLAGGLLPVTGEALILKEKGSAAAWIRAVRAQEAELVVLDLPPAISPALATALMIADLFLVPIAPSALDIRAAVQALELLREARAARGDGAPKALLVANRVDRRLGSGREAEAALHELGEPVGPTIGFRAAFIDSAAELGWVGSYAPRSAAHQEIRTLAAIVATLTKRKK